ncbi:MAG TPA: hypothetical protein VGJ13_05335 [Pseudonocardiaceae bacterium]
MHRDDLLDWEHEMRDHWGDQRTYRIAASDIRRGALICLLLALIPVGLLLGWTL